MSFMKTGQAAQWAHQELELEASQGLLWFVDWLDFEDEFWKDFTPLNAEASVVNILESTSYFQGWWSVDDYLDQFQDLIYDSGHTDHKTIVVKFWRGLHIVMLHCTLYYDTRNVNSVSYDKASKNSLNPWIMQGPCQGLGRGIQCII
jgi:hypothetical protein